MREGLEKSKPVPRYVKLCIMYHSAKIGEINIFGHFMCKLTWNPEHLLYVGPNETLLVSINTSKHSSV
jgi:hypothetical protein